MHINSRLAVIFTATVFANIFLSGAYAAFTCSVENDCPTDYKDLFHMSSTSNAHAELNTQTAYDWKVCCAYTDPGGAVIPGFIDSLCSGSYDEVLWLSAPTNAHVETDPPQYYSNSVCLSASSGMAVSCDYRTTSCNAGETCIASISAITNAHVADCSGYSTKVCCNVADATVPATTIDPNGHAWDANDIGFSLDCSDTGSGCYRVFYQIIDDGQSCSGSESAYTATAGSSASGTVTCNSGEDCRRRVCYYSRDNADNKETTQQSNIFYIDKKQPTISDNYAHDGEWYNGGSAGMVTIRLTPYDSGSGVQVVRTCTGTGCTPGTPLYSPYETTFTTDMNTMFRYQVWDNVDEESTIGDVNVMIDLTQPQIQVSGSPPDWENTPGEAELVCNDPLANGVASGCDGTTYRYMIFDDDPVECYIEGVLEYDDYDVYTGPVAISNHKWVCMAAKDNAGNIGFSAPVEFKVDVAPPVTTVDPLPEWINETQFRVSWSVAGEMESGIDYYVVEYRYWANLDETLAQDWIAWPGPTTEETSLIFNPLTEDNITVEFRVRGVDLAGNVETTHPNADTSIKVDVTDPVCSILDPGGYINLEEAPGNYFLIQWSGFDGGSGIEYYNITYRKTECDNPTEWDFVNSQHREWGPDELSYNFFVTHGCRYEFRCDVKDVANNTFTAGVVDTFTDLMLPTVTILGGNPDPPYGKTMRWEWTNNSYFYITWEGDGTGTDIAWYTLEWSDDRANWYPVTYGPGCQEATQTADTELTFDLHCGHPGTGGHEVVEGVTYYFTLMGSDQAGNMEEFLLDEFNNRIPEINITYDATPPSISILAFDQDNNPITSEVVSSQFVWRVYLRATATDEISGVYNNKVKYEIVEENVRRVEEDPCGGEADPWGGESYCEITNSYGEDTIIKYSMSTGDRAGNSVDTDIFYIVTHPLANFIAHNLQLSLGDTYLMELQVRNLQDVFDDVNLSLSAYPLAKFVDVGYGTISDDGRNLTIGLQPDEERLLQVKILSSEPDREYLYIAANSSIDPDLDDEDDVTMVFNYPATFPGLNELAILMLVILSTGTFWFFKKK
jgi:hypothetical protein